VSDTAVTKQTRADRVAVPGAYAELASSFAEVINVSRTGALIHTASPHVPGDRWPLVLEFSRTPVQLVARVVRCEPIAERRGARKRYALGLVFVEPSAEALALLDRMCGEAADDSVRKRPVRISFVRRCPRCRSRTVSKEARGQYFCTACRHRFAGFRIGMIRVAR
jgi:hypothetical protein